MLECMQQYYKGQNLSQLFEGGGVLIIISTSDYEDDITLETIAAYIAEGANKILFNY